MNVKTLKKKFSELQSKAASYSHAMGVMYYDAATAAPAKSAEGRGETFGELSKVAYDLQTGAATKKLLYELRDREAELDRETKRALELALEGYERICKVPKEEYVEFTKLQNMAEAVWHKAKPENDFASFAPYLEKIVEMSRKFSLYYDDKKDPYEDMLDQYEKGITIEKLDEFFGALKDGLVPLIHRISAEKQVDDSFLFGEFSIEKQRELSDYLMEIMGVDRERCIIGETEHPFTTNFNTDDVRITTHYFRDNFASSMYSVIHESGHATYELGGNPAYNRTLLSGGTSMGIHESQSRFYENIIGRSREFTALILPKVKELFPQLKEITTEQFYRAINKVQPSLIRTEADELTYCMHIIIRYELEKGLISGEIKVNDLPEKWNELYKQYLGVDVPNDTQGVLQDSHWSGAMLGYFPSYALGSAYGAQMLKAIEKDIDIPAAVKAGDLKPIVGWLTNKIYKYSSLLTPAEVIENACGAPFDPKYYIEYLTEKFSDIYGL